jgi:hypothetical protein
VKLEIDQNTSRKSGDGFKLCVGPWMSCCSGVLESHQETVDSTICKVDSRACGSSLEGFGREYSILGAGASGRIPQNYVLIPEALGGEGFLCHRFQPQRTLI